MQPRDAETIWRLAGLSAPTRRALVNAGITTIKDLSTWTEDDLLDLHGIGPKALPPLRDALAEEGLRFAS